MKILDLYPNFTYSNPSLLLDEDLAKLRKHCSQFLRETSLPLSKMLVSNKTFYKLKARYRKLDPISESINNAFQIPLLLQRSIEVNGALNDTGTMYYIFPTDGYKFIQCNNITESCQLIELYNNINNDSLYTDLIPLLSYNGNITEAATQSQNQILLYDLPYCYCINSNIVPSYGSLLTKLRKDD